MVEELGDAVERGVGDLGGGGLEREDERVQRGGGRGDGQAEERRGVGRDRVGRVVRGGGEEVERRLGRGDERRVLPPRGVFYDAVERGAEHAARRGGAAQRRRGGRHGGNGALPEERGREAATRWSSPRRWSLEAERSEREGQAEEEGWNKWECEGGDRGVRACAWSGREEGGGVGLGFPPPARATAELS